MDAGGREALKTPVIRLAARARGRCEGCQLLTTTRVFSPVEGLPDETLVLMLCVGCLETLGCELQELESVRVMQLRIAQILSPPRG